ncbi:MAG: hypothetical protein ABIZ70_16010 [Gemmatimonadales bacterium]
MPRLALRHRRPAASTPATLGAVTLGLAAGAAVGFLLSELFAGTAKRLLGEAAKPAPDQGSVAEIVHDALSVLENDLQLRECHLDVVPVRRFAIEIHGWVPDRPSRLRAQRLVAAAVAPAEVINCVLVRGEDDLAFDLIDDSDALHA